VPSAASELYQKYCGPRCPPDDAVFITVREAAYILRCSAKQTMEYTRLKKNPAPVIYINRRYPRFHREALIKWAATFKRGK
jgi:hypothetical protein